VAGDLRSTGPATPASALLAAYVAEVEARIPGWRRARRSALVELADGLDDAAALYRGLGVNADTAAARAVQECGPSSVVAAEYTRVLATGQARRTAVALLATGPLVGLLWLQALTPGQRPDALLLRVPVLAVLVATALGAGALTVAATGPAARWLPGRPSALFHAPRRATATACAAAAVSDLLILTFATWSVLAQPSGLRWMPGLVAAAASLLRFTITQRIARRDLALSTAAN
jgi:hypothetical protein